jgi:hypothetical protein
MCLSPPWHSVVRVKGTAAAVAVLCLATLAGAGGSIAPASGALIPAANWVARPASQPQGTEILRFTLSKQRRLTAVSLHIAMRCPYHGTMWEFESRNANAVHLRFAIDRNNHFRVAVRFSSTSTALNLQGVSGVSFLTTATIDGRLSSARKARGAMRFSSASCIIGSIYETWAATGYGAPR